VAIHIYTHDYIRMVINVVYLKISRHHAVIFTVEIAQDIFRILADYHFRHLVNNVAIHIYTHDYIRIEITVLYLKISRHQLWIY
jgi:hypothetical protein